MSVAALRVEISAEDADLESDEGIQGLRDELAELDVDGINSPAAGPGPQGSKGLGVTATTLIVTLSDSAVLVALARVLRSWVGRDRSRKVTVRIGEDTIEVTRASDQEQARLIEAWLARHARR